MEHLVRPEGFNPFSIAPEPLAQVVVFAAIVEIPAVKASDFDHVRAAEKGYPFALVRAKTLAGALAVDGVKIGCLKNVAGHLSARDGLRKVRERVVIEQKVHIGVEFQNDVVFGFGDSDVVGFRQAPAIRLNRNDAASGHFHQRLARAEVHQNDLGNGGALAQVFDAGLEPFE